MALIRTMHCIGLKSNPDANIILIAAKSSIGIAEGHEILSVRFYDLAAFGMTGLGFRMTNILHTISQSHSAGGRQIVLDRPWQCG